MKNHFHHALVALCAAAALSACAPIKPPQLKPSLPAQWRHEIATQAPVVDLHHWWGAFGSPQLDQLVDQALAHNNGVAAAHERVLAARALSGSESARYRPQLHARTYNSVNPDARASYFVAGFDATWELGLFGRAEGTREQTRGALDQADATLHAARVSLVGEVVRDWLLLRAAQQREQILGRVLESRRQQLHLLRVRQRLQLAAADTVDKAQASVAQAEAAQVEPQLAVDASAQRLAVLLGRSEPDPAWFKSAPVPSLGAWQLTQTPADLLRSRPEIQQAQAQVLSALGEARLARAERFPQLALGGSLIWSVSTITYKSSNQDGIASFGPLIDIPLFDWGLREAREHARQYELKAAVYAYRQAVLEGVSEAEQALGQLQHVRQRERSMNAAEQALQRSATAMQRRVSLHLASPLGRDAERVALEQAQLAQLDARTDRALAYVALFKALGGAPLPSDEADHAAATTADATGRR